MSSLEAWLVESRDCTVLTEVGKLLEAFDDYQMLAAFSDYFVTAVPVKEEELSADDGDDIQQGEDANDASEPEAPKKPVEVAAPKLAQTPGKPVATPARAAPSQHAPPPETETIKEEGQGGQAAAAPKRPPTRQE